MSFIWYLVLLPKLILLKFQFHVAGVIPHMEIYLLHHALKDIYFHRYQGNESHIFSLNSPSIKYLEPIVVFGYFYEASTKLSFHLINC